MHELAQLALSLHRHGRASGGGMSDLVRLVLHAVIWSAIARVIWSLPLPVALLLGGLAAAVVAGGWRARRRGRWGRGGPQRSEDRTHTHTRT